MRRSLCTAAALFILFLAAPSASVAQAVPVRLAPSVFDVGAPSERVEGSLATMRVVRRGCAPRTTSELRRRIVDIAIQEWAFFGLPVLDRLNESRLLPGAALGTRSVVFENTTRRAPRTTPREGARVGATIAGYWAVTPEGPWIVGTQARRWGERGAGTRWNAPWSAAFISWVMCEAGLDTPDRFERAIAHWRYVDQAIRAGDGRAEEAAYRAYEIGERPVEPGDLLCTSRRPRYRDLAERRRQMGQGARTHCDIVVQVDEAEERILAIGGNVLRAVSLKVLPGRRGPGGGVVARRTSSTPFFAHLELQGDPIGLQALSESPVLAAYATDAGHPVATPARRVLDVLGVEAPEVGPQTGR
jgi:hypothetical protein